MKATYRFDDVAVEMDGRPQEHVGFVTEMVMRMRELDKKKRRERNELELEIYFEQMRKKQLINDISAEHRYREEAEETISYILDWINHLGLPHGKIEDLNACLAIKKASKRMSDTREGR